MAQRMYLLFLAHRERSDLSVKCLNAFVTGAIGCVCPQMGGCVRVCSMKSDNWISKLRCVMGCLQRNCDRKFKIYSRSNQKSTTKVENLEVLPDRITAPCLKSAAKLLSLVPPFQPTKLSSLKRRVGATNLMHYNTSVEQYHILIAQYCKTATSIREKNLHGSKQCSS